MNTADSLPDNSLWPFACRIYRHAGVERICLHLQDQWGMNVNILLFLLWISRKNHLISVAQLRAHLRFIESWHAQQLLPLRRLRTQIPHLKQHLLPLELIAEEIELKLLEYSAQTADYPAESLHRQSSSIDIFQKNLKVYLEALNTPLHPAIQHAFSELTNLVGFRS